MPTFLLKTEPTEYSFADLRRHKRAVWDGITNNAALAFLRTARKGDEALIYHTGDEKAIVGLARIASDPYADPERPGENARGEPKFAGVDLTPLRAAATPVTLAQIKADRRFAKFLLVTQSRLSVMPVPPELDAALRTMAGL
jgi:predicted RNA-binding protein with PUA-like domain